MGAILMPVSLARRHRRRDVPGVGEVAEGFAAGDGAPEMWRLRRGAGSSGDAWRLFLVWIAGLEARFIREAGMAPARRSIPISRRGHKVF